MGGTQKNQSKRLILTFHPSFCAINRQPLSQLPSQATSRKLSAWWNRRPELKPKNVQTGFSLLTSSRLISNRGHLEGTRSTSDANGWTANDVPRIMRRSQRGKSSAAICPTRFGRHSPKKTTSGLTTALQSSHRGTPSERICSVS